SLHAGVAAARARAVRLHRGPRHRGGAGNATIARRSSRAAGDLPCGARHPRRPALAAGAEPAGDRDSGMSRTARATATALFGYVKFAIAIGTGLWLVPY